jgi:hypothetical protein
VFSFKYVLLFCYYSVSSSNRVQSRSTLRSFSMNPSLFQNTTESLCAHVLPTSLGSNSLGGPLGLRPVHALGASAFIAIHWLGRMPHDCAKRHRTCPGPSPLVFTVNGPTSNSACHCDPSRNATAAAPLPILKDRPSVVSDNKVSRETARRRDKKCIGRRLAIRPFGRGTH